MADLIYHHAQHYSDCNIYDLAKQEKPYWAREVYDRRSFDSLSNEAADLFGLGIIKISPIYFIAKSYNKGSLNKLYFHTIMSNGDEITLRSNMIMTQMERDGNLEEKGTYELIINNEVRIDNTPMNIVSVRNFYFTSWIAMQQ